jgi:uncharacterized damage-inducible protein DinB
MEVTQNTIELTKLLLTEMEQEAQTTRKMLALVPTDKLDWQPHKKSMTMRNLAAHIAELPGWVSMGLNTTVLDFAANPYEPTKIENTSELLDIFETSLKEGTDALRNASEEDLEPKWTLRNGDDIYAVMTKAELIRHSISQTIHHRAQLGVYLRLLDIPIPGSYGPSADEVSF